MNKEIITIILKVLIYALTLIGSAFGIYSLSSCSASSNVDSVGTGYFQFYDTIHVSGNNSWSIPNKLR